MLENLLQVLFVLFHSGAGDEDVINIDETKVQPPQNLVHKPLEGLACIAQAKRHVGKLEQAKRGGNRSLGHIGRLNRDLVVSPD